MDYKFSDGLNRVFKQSKNEARRLQSEFLNTEHFLLGIIKTENSAKEIAEELEQWSNRKRTLFANPKFINLALKNLNLQLS